MGMFCLGLVAILLWCSSNVESNKRNEMELNCYTLRETGYLMHRCDELQNRFCRDTYMPKCRSVALGMENGKIPDSSITANSVYTNKFRHYDRVVWRAANNHGPNQWFKVDIGKVQRIHIMDTHGYSHGKVIEFVKTFVLQYSIDGKVFRNYRGGATLKSGYVNRIKMRPAIRARYVRIIPKKWHNRVAFWMELYRFKSGQFLPLLGRLRYENFEVSSYLGDSYPAKEARLNNRFRSTREPGAWRAKVESIQWIQVDLGKVTTVTGIATQGASDGMKINAWVSRYNIQYSNDGKTFYKYSAYTNRFAQTFSGNKDRSSIVRNNFPRPIHARYIRVIPRWWRKGIVMRLELYGCPSAPRKPSMHLPTKKEACQYLKRNYICYSDYFGFWDFPCWSD